VLLKLCFLLLCFLLLCFLLLCFLLLCFGRCASAAALLPPCQVRKFEAQLTTSTGSTSKLVSDATLPFDHCRAHGATKTSCSARTFFVFDPSTTKQVRKITDLLVAISIACGCFALRVIMQLLKVFALRHNSGSVGTLCLYSLPW